jgi:hypothetical protein
MFQEEKEGWTNTCEGFTDEATQKGSQLPGRRPATRKETAQEEGPIHLDE